MREVSEKRKRKKEKKRKKLTGWGGHIHHLLLAFASCRCCANECFSKG